MTSLEARTIAKAIFAIIPPLIMFFTYNFTHDALIILFTLTIAYVLLPLIYDQLIYNLRWEMKYGPELTNLSESIGPGVGSLLGGFLLASLLWVICYVTSTYIIEVEVTPFPFVNSAFSRFVYFALVILYGIIIVPITEELFYRSFLAGEGGIGGIISIVSYVALNHIKFSNVYPNEYWMVIVIDIIFAVMGGILNMLSNKSIIQGVGLSIGFSLAWLLRIILLKEDNPFSEPLVFLFYDYLNVWN